MSSAGPASTYAFSIEVSSYAFVVMRRRTRLGAKHRIESGTAALNTRGKDPFFAMVTGTPRRAKLLRILSVHPLRRKLLATMFTS